MIRSQSSFGNLCTIPGGRPVSEIGRGLPEGLPGEGASHFGFLRGTRGSCDAWRFGRFFSFDSGPSRPGSGDLDALGDASGAKATRGGVPGEREGEEEADDRRTSFVMKKS